MDHNPMNLEEYQKLYGGQDAATPGWDAIDSRLKPVYSDQEPKHWQRSSNICSAGPIQSTGSARTSAKTVGETTSISARRFHIALL